MKKVMVFGTFDIIHPGHLNMFEQAKQYGDFLVIVVARDTTVCKVKKRPAQFTEEIRLENIKKLNVANKVRLGCIDDHYSAIADEKPDIIALGYDQKEFVDNLVDAIDDYVQIVRLSPFKPEIYKSSKMK